MEKNRPSATAQIVAAGVCFISRDPVLGYLVPPPAARASARFLEASSTGRRLLFLIDKPWLHGILKLVERLTVPGLVLHWVLRKRYLEEVVCRAIEEDFEQIVILGAGFDTLALRLHGLYPNVLFLEMDHPLTQAVKQGVLESEGVAAPNLVFLPVDLSTEELAGKLNHCGAYDRGRRTLWIAEGLLMYLREEAVDRVFRSLREMEHPGGRVAFTFLEPGSGGRASFAGGSRIIDLWLRLRGEPFRLGIREDDLRGYLMARHFLLLETASPEALLGRYLPPELLHRRANGDAIAVAEC